MHDLYAVYSLDISTCYLMVLTSLPPGITLAFVDVDLGNEYTIEAETHHDGPRSKD